MGFRLVPCSVQENVKAAKKEYDRTEDDLKALQSVGQIIGEVLRQLDSERLIVKASSGPRYVVGCRNKVDKEKLVAGTRVALDMTTLTIMRALPREVSSLYSVWDSGVLLHWESLNDLYGSSCN
jgi:26S proteasome regulatory subunit T4